MSKQLNKLLFFLYDLFFGLFVCGVSFFIKKDSRAFAFGSWVGNSFSDNSKYLFLYFLEKSEEYDLTLYWVGNKTMQKDLPADVRFEFIELNKIKSAFKLLRCKYFFCSQFQYADISKYNIYHNGKIIFLGHGIPIKRIGHDVNYYKNRGYLSSALHSLLVRKVDYILSSSEIQTDINSHSYIDQGAKRTNSLCIGTPRNDFLISSNRQDIITKLKHDFCKRFNLDVSQKIVLYMPTFRKDINNTPSIFFSEDDDFTGPINELMLKTNAVLIEKSHNRLIRRNIRESQDYLKKGNIHYLGSMYDSQELLLISDYLISDFSGCILDYLLLDKPIIHYIPDYENYIKNDAGLYFDLEEFVCGELALKKDELVSCISKTFSNDSYSAKRHQAREKFLSFEKGNSSRSLFEICVGKKKFSDFTPQ